MSLTAPASVYVVLLLSVQVVQGRNGWGVTYTSTQICALKGSTVEMSCTYRYPSSVTVQVTLWYTTKRNHVDLRTESEYSGRVQYICTYKRCTLRITDLRESDSVEYMFRFITSQQGGKYSGSPGVTLSVTALQVQVNTISVYQYSTYAELKCHSSCSPAGRLSYVWFKNGQKVTEEETSSYKGWFYPEDFISCALKGHENYGSPPVCVNGQNCNRVTYTDRSICAFKGSSVDISCTYNSYDGSIMSKFWFSPERRDQRQRPSQPEDLSEDSLYAGRVQVLETERGRSTLRIRDLRESDSAQYHFKFKTPWFEWRSVLPGTTLTVTALQVQVNTISVYQYSTYAELKCHSSCSPAGRLSYVWFKNGQKVTEEETSSYKGWFHHRDSISCALTGHENYDSPSVCIHGQNCNRVTYTDRSICAFKGSSVDISCTYNSYDGSITSKFWFSPERSDQWQSPSQPEDLSEGSLCAGRVQVLETGRGHSTLRIRDLRESDSAQYHFKFKTPWFEWRSVLPGTTLTVTALQVQVNTISVYQYYTNAELKCHSSCSPAGCLSYVWFKNGQKVTEETSSYKGWFDPEDFISCALKGQENYGSPSVYAPKLPSVSVSPSSEIVENRSVNLTCSSDANPAAKYTWYKKNEDPDPQPLSKEAELVFRSIQSSDSGEYYCTAENELGRSKTSESISINVKYAPKLPSVSVSPSGEIVENSSVNLTCSSDANPAAKYTWYKEKQKLLQRPTGIYHFTSISSEDRGNYYCKSENQHGQIDSSSLFIDVQYAPKLHSVSVSPPAEIAENSSVTLTCSSDANPAANYTWYKENGDPDRQPLSKEAELVFISIQSSDSGEYYCTAENKLSKRRTSGSISINVKYPPRLTSVSVSPSGETLEGSSVTLTCSSDANPAANYTWYKENEDSPKASGQIFTITDSRPEHSGNYYCEAHNRRGRHNSTLHLIVVAGSMKSVAVGSITVIFLAIIFLSAFLLIRKKKCLKETTERPDNNAELNMATVSVNHSAAVQGTPAEEQGDLCYASVSFSKHQEDPLYSNIRPFQPNRHKNEEQEEEDEGSVEYSVVNLKSGSAFSESKCQDAVQDPSALYSTVIKKPRV